MQHLRVSFVSLFLFTFFAVALTCSASASTCSPPSTSDTVKICMPTNNASINGPVELSAAANVSGLSLIRVYDDDVPMYETPMSSFDTFLYIGSGLHDIRVVAYDSSNNAFQKDTNIIVSNGSAGQPCGIPTSSPAITFCYPTAGLTVGSPVTFSTRARWDCCNISHIRLYVDNKDIYDADYSDTIFTQLPMAPGQHNATIVAWDNQGAFIKNSETFKVVSNSCTPTGSVSFCWPANNTTVPSTIQVTAASSVKGLTLMRLYDNDQQMLQTSNSSFNTNLAVGQGLHHLVVVAYDSSGNAYTDQRFIRVTNTGTQSPCGIPDSGRDINICAPAEFSTVTPLFTVSARAQWNGQNISHIRVYMDNKDVYDADYQEWVYKQFSLASGGHHMVITVWDNAGSSTSVARTFFTQ